MAFGMVAYQDTWVGCSHGDAIPNTTALHRDIWRNCKVWSWVRDLPLILCSAMKLSVSEEHAFL